MRSGFNLDKSVKYKLYCPIGFSKSFTGDLPIKLLISTAIIVPTRLLVPRLCLVTQIRRLCLQFYQARQSLWISVPRQSLGTSYLVMINVFCHFFNPATLNLLLNILTQQTARPKSQNHHQNPKHPSISPATR